MARPSLWSAGTRLGAPAAGTLGCVTDHGELGSLLRSWRDRLSPADVGTTTGGVRRAAGLRREELAALAGVSVDYVVRLEQGRARTPSAQVVAALGRALQLDRAERDHLYTLAGLRPPGDALVSTHVPAGVQRMVTRMGDVPIAVFTASWDILLWSPTWAALFGEPAGRTAWERNLVVQTFHEDLLAEERIGRAVHADGGAAFRASLVAGLRRAQGRHPDDPGLRALIGRLRAAAPSSTGCGGPAWSGSTCPSARWSSTRRRPVGGRLRRVHRERLGAADRGHDRARRVPAEEKLDFLRVTGAAVLG